MAVTSRPTAEPVQRAKRIDVRTAPIHADDLDTAGAIFRLVIGIGMIGYSIATTALIFGHFLAPVITTGLYLWFMTIPWGVLIGIAFGITVTFAEWVTTKRAPLVRWLLVLFLDAPFSAGQTAIWLWVIADTYKASTPWYAGIIVLSIAWGIFVAWLGEKLLIKKD